MVSGGENVATRTSPTVRRRMLAAELKRLRLAAKKSRDQAAQHISVTGTTITRIEAMTTAAKPGDVALLLNFYGVTDSAQIAFLVSLARDARKPGWWQPYREAIPARFETYVGLESEAEELRSYDAEFVPGLLQTADYYRACLLADPAAVSEEEADKLITFRLARQTRVLSTEGPKLWVVINEAVLGRLVGGKEVMRAQLQHLIEQNKRPNLKIQVLPFSAGAHPAMDGSFMILDFPVRSHTDVVYLESQADSRYLETPVDVDRYNLVFNHLRAQASSIELSLQMLTETERNI